MFPSHGLPVGQKAIQLQGELPLYAQVRHGPIEYGKDIVALLAIDGSVVLRHYQVKCGDIDKKKWRVSKDELEEVFGSRGAR